MNARGGREAPKRFRPDELDLDAEAGDPAELLSTARALEWLAATDDLGPSAGFADRVMAAIAEEPAPRPVEAALGAIRQRKPRAVLAALGDVWRVAFGGGARPFAMRLPAMALVIVLLAGLGGVGALGAGALAGIFNHGPVSPVASPVAPVASPRPSELESPDPNVTPAVIATPGPSPSPTESPEPSESSSPDPSPDEPDEGNTGTGSGHSTSTEAPATEAPQAGDTPRPTPRATRVPSTPPPPTHHPEESHRPRETPKPTPTPTPSQTPHNDGANG